MLDEPEVIKSDLIGEFKSQSWVALGAESRPPDFRRATLESAQELPDGIAVVAMDGGKQFTAKLEVPEPERARLLEVLGESEGLTLLEIEATEL